MFYKNCFINIPENIKYFFDLLKKYNFFQNLGFSNADLVLVQKKPSHLVPSTSKQNDRTNIIADLVKAIKVPSHSKLNPNQVIARKHNLLESDIAAVSKISYFLH